MRRSTWLACVWCACAGAPRPTIPGPVRTARELLEQSGVINDRWNSLRADVVIAIELYSQDGTERRGFTGTLVAERPARVRLHLMLGDGPYCDLLWLGGGPQIARPIPEAERSTRLREIIGVLAEDISVALRMTATKTPKLRVELGEAQALQSGIIPLLELREFDGETLLSRSTYDRQSLLRRQLEQGFGTAIERTIHYTNHAPAGSTMLPRIWVIDSALYDYTMTVEIRSLTVDEEVDGATWVP